VLRLVSLDDLGRALARGVRVLPGQQDNPELVQTAIRAVVSAVRNDERLATCQAIFGGVAGAERVGS
jgi:hypothetical protein